MFLGTPERLLYELDLPLLTEKRVKAFVLRLDKIHPEISGNKWFKLKEYLNDARQNQRQTIVTFGGAYSNHILATAAACRQFQFGCAGIIRGERPEHFSPTLQAAVALGMELYFTDRQSYALKNIPVKIKKKYPAAYVINEGGYGLLGVKGAKDILSDETKSHTHIITAVGTGTTLAGLVSGAEKKQQLLGVSVLKNNKSLDEEINDLLAPAYKNHFCLLHEYHFGGYARPDKSLFDFMNEWYSTTGIPTDFVYTAKAFFAFIDLLKKNYFPPGSRILLIHSGGLQGNSSLPKGTLIF